MQDPVGSGKPTEVETREQATVDEKMAGDSTNGTVASEKEMGGLHKETDGRRSRDSAIQEPVAAEGPAAVENEKKSTELATGGTATTDAEATAEDEAEDESKYLSGAKLIILSLGLCLTTFVIALDNTIIATAIPKITTVFNSLEDVAWYGSSYLLTTCSLQPSFGKVYTYFDVKWTYLAALLIFEVGSIICAAATSSAMFIVGRAVAGAGAAALFSGGMTIIGYSVALRKRPIYIAALSSMFGIASVVGPILGGALTDRVSWRWCFWINLPFGAVSLAVVFFFFSNPKREYSHMSVGARIKEIDLMGATLLICAVVSLLLALQWGGQTYAWGNSKVWGTLLAFGLIISVFIGIQIWQKERATIPLRVFKQRTIMVSCIFSALLSMALYVHLFYLPFYFQASKGTTAEESGIRTIAYLVSLTVGSIIVGGLITVIGFYAPFMWFGSAVFTIGCGMLHTLTVSSSPAQWLGYQVLAGLGCGAAVQIPFIAVQVVASEKDMPTANALVFFFNSLGGAVSLAIAQNVFINGLAENVPKYAPDVDPRVVIGAGATFVRQVVKPESLQGVLEAYTKAITQAFLISVVVGAIAFVASLGMELKSVKGKKIAMGGAA